MVPPEAGEGRGSGAVRRASWYTVHVCNDAAHPLVGIDARGGCRPCASGRRCSGTLIRERSIQTSTRGTSSSASSILEKPKKCGGCGIGTRSVRFVALSSARVLFTP